MKIKPSHAGNGSNPRLYLKEFILLIHLELAHIAFTFQNEPVIYKIFEFFIVCFFFYIFGKEFQI